MELNKASILLKNCKKQISLSLNANSKSVENTFLGEKALEYWDSKQSIEDAIKKIVAENEIVYVPPTPAFNSSEISNYRYLVSIVEEKEANKNLQFSPKNFAIYEMEEGYFINGEFVKIQEIPKYFVGYDKYDGVRFWQLGEFPPNGYWQLVLFATTNEFIYSSKDKRNLFAAIVAKTGFDWKPDFDLHKDILSDTANKILSLIENPYYADSDGESGYFFD